VTEQEQRRIVWLAVMERIGDLAVALHTTLDAVREFPVSDAESLAVDRALSQFDVAVARFHDGKVARLLAGGWPASLQRR
jgi:hypothetical protein